MPSPDALVDTPSLTIFSTPKPFEGLFDLIQRNAVTSWTLLDPRPEVILFGDAPGTADLCASLGLIHIPSVATTDHGTPLISDMFEQAQGIASHELLCFVNSDIILPQSIISAAEAVTSWTPEFLVVGQRHDLDVLRPIDFGDAAWRSKLETLSTQTAHRGSELTIDWFLFSRGLWGTIPAFAVGRLWYDNWLLWRVSDLGKPLVDASRYVRVIHQNHDYSHGGGKTAVWTGEEARANQSLLGHWSHYHAVGHARWMLNADGAVVPARGLKYRLARPRRIASHLLRFTRPLRHRFGANRVDCPRPGHRG